MDVGAIRRTIGNLAQLRTAELHCTTAAREEEKRMGAWGSGLYSNDDAADFVETVRTLLRVPKPIDQILHILREEAGDTLSDQTTLPLILADQFEKRGIRHLETFKEAIKILEEGRDLDEMSCSDFDKTDFKTRAKSNKLLSARLQKPRPEKPRKTLNKPQKTLVSKGDYVRFPTQNGCVNCPYAPQGMEEEFVPDGWGVVQIHDVGWEFDYLNWVKLFPLEWHSNEPPELDDAKVALPLRDLGYGTLSAQRFKRMHMQIIGNDEPRSDAPSSTEDLCTARFVTTIDRCVSILLVALNMPALSD